jgi:hypothetical protein
VFCFQYKSDGERFLEALGDRLVKFNLNLNRVKTHLIEFGRFAEANRAGRGTSKPQTFDFLGFTHICSRRRSDNGFSLLRKTISKRQCRTLSAIKVMLKKVYHQRPFIVGGRLKAILQGYFNYFAVPGNLTVLDHFRTAVVRMWIKAMRRRSQKGKYVPWRRYARLIALFIPKARAVHPYPSQRWSV